MSDVDYKCLQNQLAVLIDVHDAHVDTGLTSDEVAEALTEHVYTLTILHKVRKSRKSTHAPTEPGEDDEPRPKFHGLED